MEMKFIRNVLAIASLLVSAHASAYHFNQPPEHPWLIRARALYVMSQEHGSDISTINGHLDLNNAWAPELDISYFFNPNVAAELILATSEHEVDAEKTTLGDLDLGHVKLLPPTLLLQYHFHPHPNIQPYVGAGINYTHFYDIGDGAASSVSYTDNFGYAFQLGTDFNINKCWVFNLDVKKIFVRTEVDARSTAFGGKVESNLHLNPLLLGFGVGYRFG